MNQPAIPEIHIEYLYETGTRYVPKPSEHRSDVGLDIPAVITGPMTLGPGAGQFIPGGFRVQFPYGMAGLILPRSSVNRQGLHVCTGVIDHGYNGELGTEVRNITHEEITIRPGDRLSQLVLIPAWHPVPVPTVMFRETDRGEKGFGSSNADTDTNQRSTDTTKQAGTTSPASPIFPTRAET